MKSHVALILALITSQLFSQAPYDVRVSQLSSTGGVGPMRSWPVPSGNHAVAGMNGVTRLPQTFFLGSHLSFDGTHLNGVWPTAGDLGVANWVNVDPMDLPVSTAVASSIATKQALIPAGTTSQYYRGDHTWATMPLQVQTDWNASSGLGQIANKPTIDKSYVGLGLVENTALSSWAGSAGITTVGTITTGSWNGVAIADAFIASASYWNAALQPSSNISLLANDSGFITSSSISGKADKSITISAGAGLSGGGDISSNRSFALSSSAQSSLSMADTAVQPAAIANFITSSSFNALSNKSISGSDNTFSNIAQSSITGLTTALTGKEASGAAAGAQAFSIQRSNHTGTQLASTISDFSASSRVLISLTTTGSGAASYNNSTGVINVPTPATVASRVFTNNAVRPLVTVAAAANGFQVSSARDSLVGYNVTITTSTVLLGATNVSGYVALEVAATNSATASDWIEIARAPNGVNNALTVALGTLTSTGGGQIQGMVPAGWYVRIRTVNVNGTPSFVYNSGQEVIF